MSIRSLISFFLATVAAGFFAAAQSTPTPPSQSAPPKEALQLINKGQFAEAREVLAGMIEDANFASSPAGYKAQLWQLLGSAENRLGRYEQAKTALNHGLQLCDDGLPVPELTIALLLDLAGTHLSQGNLDDASRVLHRASGIVSKQLPPGHPRLASIQHSLGVLFWVQGQLSRAEKAFRLSLTILEGSLGHDHPDVAGAAGGLAGLLTMTGRQAEAIPLFERSKAIFEGLYGPAHPDTIGATYALGAALSKFSPAKAESMLRQAVANWRASQPERHPNMIKFLRALASSRYAQRDYREACMLSEQALQMSKDIFGAEHPHVIAQMDSHALLLRGTGRRKEAAALKREADRIRARNGYDEPDRQRIDVLALR